MTQKPMSLEQSANASLWHHCKETVASICEFYQESTIHIVGVILITLVVITFPISIPVIAWARRSQDRQDLNRIKVQ